MSLFSNYLAVVYELVRHFLVHIIKISYCHHIVSINVDRLNIFENGTVVTPELLLETRVISKVKDGVKILGNGTLEKSLTVQGCKMSKAAAEKIEAAGGKVEVM